MGLKKNLLAGFLVLMFGSAGILAGTKLSNAPPGPESIVKAITTQDPEVAALKPFVKGSMAAIETDHAGKPYVVAFWSMYCSHCIEEMATWRNLRKANPDFRLVMVSTDRFSDGWRLDTVLKREGLTGVESWAFDDSIAARVRSDVDKTWRGELPRIHFYDDEGNRTVRIGVVPETDVLSWLKND